MKSLFFILLTLQSMQYLFSQTSTHLVTIDLEKALSDQKEIFLSQFVDNVVFVPLENSPSSLIGEILVSYEITDEYIIVKHTSGGIHKIFLFDRTTGKFLREIGKQGRGPGEFANYGQLAYNQIKNEIYASNYSRDILVYDLFGRNIDLIKIPFVPDPNINLPNLPKEQNEKLSASFLSFYEIIDSDIFVGYFQNFSGTEKRKLMLLTKDGILKIFPNHLTWLPNERNRGFMLPPGGFAKFYKWDNKLYFLEIFCDTLYQVTKEKLIPRYYFDIGKIYKAEYSSQLEVASKWNEYYYMLRLKENKDYIFFNFQLKRDGYTGFIEKRSNNVVVCKNDLIDDISGLMNVVPYCFTKNNEIVYVIQPVKLIKWFKENPEKASVAKSRLSWLKDIDEFSNPVIAIAR
jgi:hypothetical protein